MTGESVKNTVSLMVITVVAGLLLGFVYEITKEPIATQLTKMPKSRHIRKYLRMRIHLKR